MEGFIAFCALVSLAIVGAAGGWWLMGGELNPVFLRCAGAFVGLTSVFLGLLWVLES